MSEEAELKKARFYALKVINFRPRSVEELTDKLKEKGFSSDTITEVVLEFKKKGLLDDSKFSRLWINSRMASNPKGEIVLKEELKAKGVKEEVIEELIKETKKDYNEYEVVKNLAGQRMQALKDLPKTTAKRRLYGFLQRRGFAFEVIRKVLKEMF